MIITHLLLLYSLLKFCPYREEGRLRNILLLCSRCANKRHEKFIAKTLTYPCGYEGGGVLKKNHEKKKRIMVGSGSVNK